MCAGRTGERSAGRVDVPRGSRSGRRVRCGGRGGGVAAARQTARPRSLGAGSLLPSPRRVPVMASLASSPVGRRRWDRSVDRSVHGGRTKPLGLGRGRQQGLHWPTAPAGRPCDLVVRPFPRRDRRGCSTPRRAICGPWVRAVRARAGPFNWGRSSGTTGRGGPVLRPAARRRDVTGSGVTPSAGVLGATSRRWPVPFPGPPAAVHTSISGRCRRRSVVR